MKRKIFVMIMTVCLVLSLAVPAYANANDARNSVVVVSPYLDMEGIGSWSVSHGTGFFVGETDENPTYLVTNYHVIETYIWMGAGAGYENVNKMINEAGADYKSDLQTLLRAALPYQYWKNPCRAKLRVFYDSDTYEEAFMVAYDALKDVAVLKLGNPTAERKALPLSKPDDALVGKNIYAIGFPGIADNFLTESTTSWGSADATVTGGTLSRIYTESGTGRKTMQIDCNIKAGNSGGPLVNEEGAVVGVNTFTISGYGEELYYAVAIDEVISILNRENVTYALAGAPVPTEAPTEPADTTEATETTQVTETTEPVKPGPGPIVWVGGGAVVALIVLALVFLRKKKPAAPAVPVTPVAPATPVTPVQKTPYVRSCSAQHNGLRIRVQSQPIILGRNPSTCKLVYQESTPGVSSQHCSLSWNADAQKFMLTDLNSTYGTYLQNGQRLAPHTPHALNVQEQFYLGERSNSLILELE